MKTVHFLIGILLLSLVHSETVSLTNLLNNDDLSQGCLQAAFGQCILCQDDYELSNGECSKPTSSEDTSKIPADVNPCENTLNCGDSEKFKSSNQFDGFINEFGEEQGSTDPQPSTAEQPESAGAEEPQPQPQADPQPEPATREAQPAANIISPATKRVNIKTDVKKAEAKVVTNVDFSETNNQEENVDEADFLKTDGRYIYSVSRGVVSILRAYPYYKAQVLYTFEERFSPKAILLEDDSLAIIGTERHSIFGWVTYVVVYDVGNRSAPKLIKKYYFEGRYFDGRKTEDGFIYVLASQRIYKRPTPTPWFKLGNVETYLDLDQIYKYTGDYVRPTYMNIFAFNLKSAKKEQVNIISLIIERTHEFYMSERNMYITFTKYLAGKAHTIIHKVFVWKLFLIPFADAIVPGYVNNQFSLDEYKGYLRIATTDTNPNSNNVFSLDFFLNVKGELRGIAPGERIFSARYIGYRLYLVTFRVVDPFYVISFKDHKKPVILGELKITGFSRYLHPYDDETIIGFGRQATQQGVQLGLKVSLFNVKDVANPQEIASFQLTDRNARSLAEWEHKAFLFSKEKQLLVLPGSLRGKDNLSSFNGAFVFRIKKDSITLRGLVSHIMNPSDNFNDRYVQRSLYIDEFLYTKSDCLLRINQLETLSSLKDVEIPCK